MEKVCLLPLPALLGQVQTVSTNLAEQAAVS